MIGEGARVKVYDPQGRKHGEALLKDVEWCASALEAAIEADIVVVLTEWNEFRAINLATLKSRMRGTMLFDMRNIFRPEDAKSAGLSYQSIGRPAGDAISMKDDTTL